MYIMRLSAFTLAFSVDARARLLIFYYANKIIFHERVAAANYSRTEELALACTMVHVQSNVRELSAYI